MCKKDTDNDTKWRKQDLQRRAFPNHLFAFPTLNLLLAGDGIPCPVSPRQRIHSRLLRHLRDILLLLHHPRARTGIPLPSFQRDGDLGLLRARIHRLARIRMVRVRTAAAGDSGVGGPTGAGGSRLTLPAGVEEFAELEAREGMGFGVEDDVGEGEEVRG